MFSDDEAVSTRTAAPPPRLTALRHLVEGRGLGTIHYSWLYMVLREIDALLYGVGAAQAAAPAAAPMAAMLNTVMQTICDSAASISHQVPADEVAALMRAADLDQDDDRARAALFSLFLRESLDYYAADFGDESQVALEDVQGLCLRALHYRARGWRVVHPASVLDDMAAHAELEDRLAPVREFLHRLASRRRRR